MEDSPQALRQRPAAQTSGSARGEQVKITFEPILQDYGGKVTYQAETTEDVVRLIGPLGLVSRLDASDTAQVVAYAGHLGDPSALVLESFKESRPWYECNAWLGTEFSTPYIDWLKGLTGYECPTLPDLDLGPAWCHTGLCPALSVRDGQLNGVVYVTAEPWAGMTADQYADQCASRFLARRFGEEPLTPEYLPNNNGTFRLNPDYGRGPKPPRPAAKDDGLKAALWSWWLENHATEAQQAIIAAEPPSKYGEIWDRARNGFYIKDAAGTIDYDGRGDMRRHVSLRDFVAMAGQL